MDILRSKHYPIIWFKGKTFFSDLSTKEKNLWFAVCGYSKRIFKFCHWGLTVIVVQDLIVDEERNFCEEGQRCLDFSCLLNRTTRQSFACSMNINAKKLTEDFGKRPIKFNRKTETELNSFIDLFERYPIGQTIS